MGETPNLAPDGQPVSAGALRVTCPHCGAHGEAVDMVEFVAFRDVTGEKQDSGEARFTCCGLWGDLAVAEPTPEDAA